MISDKLRRIRKDKNLTMKELAKKCGTASSYISDLENGKIKKPSAEKLIKIADTLGVTMNELLSIEKLGSSDTYTNDNGKVTHVYPKKNIENPKLSKYSDIELLSEYIGRKADENNHIINNWKEIIDNVNKVIEGEIAKGIIKRGIKID